MALETFDLAQVRFYVPWEPPTDADLDADYEALVTEYGSLDGRASWQRVARDRCRAKLQTILGNPTGLTIPGEYGESWSANVDGLRRAIAELDSMIVAAVGDGTARLTRVDRYR